MKEILRTEQLVKNYPKKKQESSSEEIKVLKQIDLSINENEYVGIMGRSGCGKTTLLKILGLIERQTSGKVFFEGTDTKTLWERVGGYPKEKNRVCVPGFLSDG